MPEVLVVIGVGGMGEAIARRCGAGKKVVLADFNKALLDGLATRLAGDGFDVTAQVVDVADRASVASLASCAAGLGAVTQVAHTAGLSPVQASAAAIVQVDLVGVANSIEEFGAIIASGGAGVVIASMAGSMAVGKLPAEAELALTTTPAAELASLPFLAAAASDPGAAYGVAKRANQVRVQAASLAWGARGARLNSISPGVVSTPMGQAELAAESGAMMRGMIAASGTGRVGTPTDIASAAAFLLGPDSSFITGTDLLVDGGVVAAIRSGAFSPRA